MPAPINSTAAKRGRSLKSGGLTSKPATGLVGTIWRAGLVAAGYVSSLVATGIVAGLFGFDLADVSGGEAVLQWTFIAGLMLALVLGPLAARMSISRGRQTALWFSLVFFNLGSVAIEGAFFAPELVLMPLPLLFLQQLLASAIVALLITLFFSKPVEYAGARESLRMRPWYSWTWRFLAGCLTYLLAYFVFGALNYSLVTQPYYETHAFALNVPPPDVILTVEALRGPLIVLSIGLFVFSYQAPRRRLALITGFLLFWVGGIVPLIFQVGVLPAPLLAASAVEIFFQNMLTGVVAAILLRPPRSDPSHLTSAISVAVE